MNHKLLKMLIPSTHFLKILTPFLGSIYIATLIFTRNIIIIVKIEFSLRLNSRVSSVPRPRSEDPHRRERKCLFPPAPIILNQLNCFLIIIRLSQKSPKQLKMTVMEDDLNRNKICFQTCLLLVLFVLGDRTISA